MERAPFVTPAMSILLDAVRGGAAIVVLLGHMVQTGIYTGSYPFGPLAQHNAVVVFFVLSGLVIAHSVADHRGTLRDYAIARATRILPVSLFALAFGTAVYAIVTAFDLEPALQLAPYDRLSPATVLLPAAFLSESWNGVGPVWNPPYWSLAYEVWFYALFGAAYWLEGRRRVAWLAVLGLVAGWRILLMLPIWLMGAALARYAGDWQPTRTKALQLALAGAIALFVASDLGHVASLAMYVVHAQVDYPLKNSNYFLTDYLFGAGIALLFVAARPFAEAGHARLHAQRGPIRWLAGFSFSLYILHWPMLSVLSACGIGAGDNPFSFAALAAGIVGLCAAIARITEYRSRDLRRWVTARLARRSEPLPA